MSRSPEGGVELAKSMSLAHTRPAKLMSPGR